MTAQVSLIIVSQDRPDHLATCLESLRNQTHRDFEVIVVGDHLPANFGKIVKYIPFRDANIAAARNLGTNLAAADILAFCDDDSVPDPGWLTNLLAPFADPKIATSGGFTRGRNGISRQWGAMRFDLAGCDIAFEMDESAPFQIFEPDTKTPVKLIGTNMAFRASALRDIGGFDEAFHFFLEDADAKLRLDQKGWKSALVPSAQVHHSFAASARRTPARIPTDLYEIGASKAHFCAKHMPETQVALQEFQQQQRERLEKLQGEKRLTPQQSSDLLQGLENGLNSRPRRAKYASKPTPAPFLLFPIKSGPHVLLCARMDDKIWLADMATKLHNAGARVTALQLLPSIRYFQVRFGDGYWQHRGGVWGKSIRTEPLLAIRSYAQKFRHEQTRIMQHANIEFIAYNAPGQFQPNAAELAVLAGYKVETL
ncbi:MAG: glycosyltransferase [Paracoccaceae bacterium]